MSNAMSCGAKVCVMSMGGGSVCEGGKRQCDVGRANAYLSEAGVGQGLNAPEREYEGSCRRVNCVPGRGRRVRNP